MSPVAQTSAAPAFTQWMDDFFASYYRHRPVNATFTGEHRYDARLPDFSENGLADCAADMKSLLQRLHVPPEPLSPVEWLDRTVAEGFLRIQLWEYESDHFFRRNPSFYAGEAVFSVIGLFLTPFAPLPERLAAATERLRAIPDFLRQARKNVPSAPAAWTERAIRECDGSLDLYRHGIDLLLADEGVDDQRLREAADLAARATAEFRAYLQDELLQHPNEAYRCGEEAFDLLMRQGHFLDLTGAEIVEYAENALAEADVYLAAHAADFGARTPDEALAQLASLHPPPDCYYARYRELWEGCRAAAVDKRLLTWPDFPIEYVPRPRWARGCAPHLYFLFYRSPATFQRPPVHRYLVAPLDEAATRRRAGGLPAGEQRQRHQAQPRGAPRRDRPSRPELARLPGRVQDRPGCGDRLRVPHRDVRGGHHGRGLGLLCDRSHRRNRLPDAAWKPIRSTSRGGA